MYPAAPAEKPALPTFCQQGPVQGVGVGVVVYVAVVLFITVKGFVKVDGDFSFLHAAQKAIISNIYTAVVVRFIVPP